MPSKIALGTCGEYTLGCEVGHSRGARNPARGVEVVEERLVAARPIGSL